MDVLNTCMPRHTLTFRSQCNYNNTGLSQNTAAWGTHYLFSMFLAFCKEPSPSRSNPHMCLILRLSLPWLGSRSHFPERVNPTLLWTECRSDHDYQQAFNSLWSRKDKNLDSLAQVPFLVFQVGRLPAWKVRGRSIHTKKSLFLQATPEKNMQDESERIISNNHIEWNFDQIRKCPIWHYQKEEKYYPCTHLCENSSRRSGEATEYFLYSMTVLKKLKDK